MAFGNTLFLCLATAVCIIGDVKCTEINSGFLDIYDTDYDTDYPELSRVPSFKRDIGDFRFLENMAPADSVPDYIRVMEKLIPGMKNKLGVFKGQVFFPRSSENYAPESGPTSVSDNEHQDPSSVVRDNRIENETYLARNFDPEGVLMEEAVTEGNSIPDTFLIQPPDNELYWEDGGEDQARLNSNLDKYKFFENSNTNFNEKVVNINKFEAKTDFPKDSILGCYNHCLQNCYGASSRPPVSHCESGRQHKPLIININSECSARPGHRFTPGCSFKHRSSIKSMKYPTYSGAFYEMPHFYC